MFQNFHGLKRHDINSKRGIRPFESNEMRAETRHDQTNTRGENHNKNRTQETGRPQR